MTFDDLESVKPSESLKDFPEEQIFSLIDLKILYRDFALRDENIKNFIETVQQMVTTGEA